MSWSGLVTFLSPLPKCRTCKLPVEKGRHVQAGNGRIVTIHATPPDGRRTCWRDTDTITGQTPRSRWGIDPL